MHHDNQQKLTKTLTHTVDCDVSGCMSDYQTYKKLNLKKRDTYTHGPNNNSSIIVKQFKQSPQNVGFSSFFYL